MDDIKSHYYSNIRYLFSQFSKSKTNFCKLIFLVSMIVVRSEALDPLPSALAENPPYIVIIRIVPQKLKYEINSPLSTFIKYLL